jgi:NAD(P)-dependent dehydrogenase (short-subunit alcohol dehydrogenase family)
VFTLDGKVAIITGGASGIGAATARLMASLNASVVIADINQAGALERVAEIEAAGGTALAVETDVCEEAQVKRVVDTAVETYGRLDILHNNAAAIDIIGEDLEITSQDLANWDATMRADLTGPMLGCKHGIPAMLKTGGGSIINTASVSGIGAEAYMTGYPVAKAAVIHLSRSVALQWGRQGIRCNSIAPGLTLSPAGLGMPIEMRDMYIRHNMVPYVGEPEDIAPTVAFLASDMSRYITGQCIQIDGGITGFIPIAADYRDFAAGLDGLPMSNVGG